MELAVEAILSIAPFFLAFLFSKVQILVLPFFCVCSAAPGPQQPTHRCQNLAAFKRGSSIQVAEYTVARQRYIKEAKAQIYTALSCVHRNKKRSHSGTVRKPPCPKNLPKLMSQIHLTLIGQMELAEWIGFKHHFISTNTTSLPTYHEAPSDIRRTF